MINCSPDSQALQRSMIRFAAMLVRTARTSGCYSSSTSLRGEWHI